MTFQYIQIMQKLNMEVLRMMLSVQSKVEHLVILDMSPNYQMLLVAIFNLFMQKYPTLRRKGNTCTKLSVHVSQVIRPYLYCGRIYIKQQPKELVSKPLRFFN